MGVYTFQPLLTIYQYGFLGIAFSNISDSVPKSGFFKILLRVLKVTGDIENEDDFETWLSPTFEIKQ
jgi:hypothetical protein